MTAARTKAKAIARGIVIRNFIEQILYNLYLRNMINNYGQACAFSVLYESWIPPGICNISESTRISGIAFFLDKAGLWFEPFLC